MILKWDIRNISKGEGRFCTACKRDLANKNAKCKKDKNNPVSLNRCPNKSSHRYSSRIYDPFRQRSVRVVVHKTKNYKEYKLDHTKIMDVSYEILEEHHFGSKDKAKQLIDSFRVKKKEVKETREVAILNQMSVWDAMKIYSDWLMCKIGYDHEKRPGTQEAINRKGTLSQFAKILHHLDINISMIRIDSITQEMVHRWYEFMGSDVGLPKVKPPRPYSPKTLNNKRDQLSMFINWCNDRGASVNNQFKLIKKNKVDPSGDALSYSELEQIFSVIKPENGPSRWKGKKENFYRDDLKLAIAIAFYTGMRRGNIITLKWSDIKIKKGEYIVVYDAHKEGSRKVAPVVSELKGLLLSHGIEEKIGLDERIVLGNYTIGHAAHYLSQAFIHYATMVGIKKTLKSCRDRYATWLISKPGSDMISLHSNKHTTRMHYADQEEIAARISSNE